MVGPGAPPLVSGRGSVVACNHVPFSTPACSGGKGLASDSTQALHSELAGPGGRPGQGEGTAGGTGRGVPDAGSGHGGLNRRGTLLRLGWVCLAFSAGPESRHIEAAVTTGSAVWGWLLLRLWPQFCCHVRLATVHLYTLPLSVCAVSLSVVTITLQCKPLSPKLSGFKT